MKDEGMVETKAVGKVEPKVVWMADGKVCMKG